jgi:hypothetical protein
MQRPYDCTGTFDATGTGWSVVLGTNGEVTNVRFTREVNTPLDYPYGTTYDCNSAATTASPGMITLTPHVGLEMFIVTFGGNGYTGTATDDKPGVSVGGSCSGYASTVTLLNGQISTIALTAGMEGKDCDTGDTYSTSNGAGGLYDANTNDKVLPVFIGDQVSVTSHSRFVSNNHLLYLPLSLLLPLLQSINQSLFIHSFLSHLTRPWAPSPSLPAARATLSLTCGRSPGLPPPVCLQASLPPVSLPPHSRDVARR